MSTLQDNSDKKGSPLAVVVWLGLGVFMIYLISKQIDLSANHRYSVGVTEGNEGSGRGTFVKYSFEVRGARYTGNRQLEEYDPIRKGGRYFVMFSPEDPTVNQILWDQPVPEHIANAPRNGWKEIPDTRQHSQK